MERLAAVETGPACNNFFDHSVPENELRRRNLEVYLQEMLDRRPKILLVGEAPGFRGMRITGVPFTNRTILEGPANSFGLFGPGKGYVLPPEAAGVAAEPTATVMWEVLEEVDFLPLLWSAFPWHPHQPGQPLSNRTPQAVRNGAGDPVLAGPGGAFCGSAPSWQWATWRSTACSAAAWMRPRSGIPPMAAGPASSRGSSSYLREAFRTELNPSRPECQTPL